MPTPTRTHSTPNDLTAALRVGIERLTSSEQWERYLAFQAAFHEYSFGNVVLIATQRPGATRVAGFSTWRDLGRWVRRGERAIWILAPVRRRDARTESDGGERESRLLGFRRVAVFDISQTDGAPPPEVVHRLRGEEGGAQFDELAHHAGILGYRVEDATLGGVANGECDFATRRIRVEAANGTAQRTKTLAHELAHALLHEDEEDRALAELEAESVAFVVCPAVGLDTGDYSFGYVASWAGGGPAAIAAVRASGERIARAAAELIGALGTVAAPGVRTSPVARPGRALLRSA